MLLGFIGYLPLIAELLTGDIKDSDDDQLYYTKQFLNDDRRVSCLLCSDCQTSSLFNV